MSSDPGRRDGAVSGEGLRIALICGRYNDEITLGLVAGARLVLAERTVSDSDITEVWVPGAFDMPVVAQRLATGGDHDAVIALGAVIRGDTAHFEHVAGQCAAGLARVGLDTGVPVIFGVLTTETRDQALQRSSPGPDNKGAEAGVAAVEMARLLASL